MAIRRIRKQISDHQLNPAEGICIQSEFQVPSQTNQKFVLTAWMVGPDKSPYQGGVFKLQIELPTCYPFRQPKMKFMTKIYHPNVNRYGYISVQWLAGPRYGNDWSPALTVQMMLSEMRTLLKEPNTEYFLNVDIALECKNNRKDFNNTASEWCRKYAM